MSQWGERRPHLPPWLWTIPLLCLALAWTAPEAGADPPSLGGGTNWKPPPEVSGPPAPTKKKKPPAEKKGPPAPEKSGPPAPKKGGSEKGAETEALEPEDEIIGGTGQIDPIAGLGLHNPVCDKPGEIRSTKIRLSCEENGSPEGTYPTTNYAFDMFIDGGWDDIGGSGLQLLVQVLEWIWLGLLHILKVVLALLGIAFGLNPFSDGKSMHEIAAALDRVYRTVTSPWLSVAIVMGGIWFAYKGLLKREFAASVGGTLAGIAMLIVGLWIINQPAATVGRLAKLSDRAAITVISAPRSGSLARPSGTYAEALAHVWAQLTEVPFAGLNFSDVRWAMGPPPPEAVERADEKFCEDIGTLTLLANMADLGSEEAKKACTQFAQKRYGRPKRVIDLYLRSSAGSPARDALWQYFDKDEADLYKAKVAAQGGDGAMTRFSMLALFAVGLVGAMMLLAWLAIRLFTQAAIAFVLLLAAPFAVFFPMLGDTGRRAFKTWGLALVGATLAKIVYAAFLSVVLLGMTILGSIGDATGFLLASAFAWAVFLKRVELIGWMSIGDVEGGRHVSPIAQFMAFSAARKLARGTVGGATGTARGVGRRGAQAARRRLHDGSEATQGAAQSAIDSGARGLADTRHSEAKKTVAKYERKHGKGGSSSGGPNGSKKGAGAQGSGQESGKQSGGSGKKGTSKPPTEQETQRYEAAKKLLDHTKNNKAATGEPWTEQDMKQFGAEHREALNSKSPLDRAHLAGMERSQVEGLRGEKRQEANKKIAQATERAKKQLTVASETPGRVRGGRHRRAGERYRQLKESQRHPDRVEALKKLRKERREVAYRARRRNVGGRP